MTLPAAPSPFPRLRGLDGIRALAVAAVVAFHLGWDRAPGGFLGVEVFFVVSGYLITALLVHEWQKTRGISLRQFWLRRARRLLPALYALLLGTLAVAAIAYPEELARLRTDALAAIAYVTNWYLIAVEQPYFETVGRPSAFLHLWSLAIEEQFYLLWPLALVGALAFGGRTAARVVAIVGIGVSVALTIALYVPADPSRVYYGTDTRAAGLLIGAVLALLYVPTSVPAGPLSLGLRRVFPVATRPARRGGLGLDLVAAAGLATLVGAFALVAETELAFPAALLVVDVATAVVIIAVVGPAARFVPAVLETAPMLWLGTRSYAVYLWHWPVIVFSRPVVDIPLDGPANLAFRLVLIGVLAEASYRFVERPIRGGAIGRLMGRMRSGRTSPALGLRSLRGAAATTTSLGVIVLLVTVAMASPPPAPSEVPVADVRGFVTPPPEAVPEPTTPAGRPPEAEATAPAVSRPEETAAPSADPSAPAERTARPAQPADVGTITAFGESVFIAAAPRVAEAIGPFELDAEIGRQMEEHVDVIRARAANGTLGDVVILAIGNNGWILRPHLEPLMPAIRDVPVVAWINLSLAREWADHNNRLIAAIAERDANVRLVDWHQASWGRPELFAEDQVHPNEEGAAVLAGLIRDAIAAP